MMSAPADDTPVSLNQAAAILSAGHETLRKLRGQLQVVGQKVYCGKVAKLYRLGDIRAAWQKYLSESPRTKGYAAFNPRMRKHKGA